MFTQSQWLQGMIKKLKAAHVATNFVFVLCTCNIVATHTHTHMHTKHSCRPRQTSTAISINDMRAESTEVELCENCKRLACAMSGVLFAAMGVRWGSNNRHYIQQTLRHFQQFVVFYYLILNCLGCHTNTQRGLLVLPACHTACHKPSTVCFKSDNDYDDDIVWHQLWLQTQALAPGVHVLLFASAASAHC